MRYAVRIVVLRWDVSLSRFLRFSCVFEKCAEFCKEKFA